MLAIGIGIVIAVIIIVIWAYLEYRNSSGL
jgi:hypothetical protein